MAYELFYSYRDDIEKFLRPKDVDFPEQVKRLPHIKHFWVSKLIETKIAIKDKQKELDKMVEAVREIPKIQMSEKSLRAMVESSENGKKIVDKIEELQVIQEYLERVEKTLSACTYDYKNILEQKKMELL